MLLIVMFQTLTTSSKILLNVDVVAKDACAMQLRIYVAVSYMIWYVASRRA